MSLYTQLYVYNLCPFQFNYRPFRRKPESIDTTKLHNFLKKTNHRLIYFWCSKCFIFTTDIISTNHSVCMY